MDRSMIFRTVILAALVVGLVCVVLLLNITAPNPTGRRYSSEVIDRDASVTEKGLQGERILAQDLGLSLTNERDKDRNAVICVCGDQYAPDDTPPQCSECAVYTDNVSNFRIPDVTTAHYLAESKNAESLLLSHNRDYKQLQEMAGAAIALNVPLWLYVRVDTLVHQDYVALAESTGGGVVHYFAYAGYQDRVDIVATVGLVLAVIAIVVVLIWRGTANRSVGSSSPPEDVNSAEDSVDATEEFMNRVERLSRKELDDDASRKDQSSDQ